MKNVFCFVTAFVFGSLSLANAQSIAQGTVTFTVTTSDTVNHTTDNLPDTIYYKYYFKNENSRLQRGTDSINNSLIVNTEGRYLLNVSYGNKRYSFDSLSGYIDSLINFWDTTTVRYMITSEHKTILGYTCTLGYFFFVSLGDSIYNPGDTTSMMSFWFTSEIKGNHLIPGAGETTLNLNGLILEYQMPVTNGMQVISASSVSTDPLDDSIFFPDLTGYINEDAGEGY